MSDSTDVSTCSTPKKGSMPVWFTAGILGVFLGGAGGILLAMYGYDYRMKKLKTPDGAAADAAALGAEPPAAGTAAPTAMGGPGMGGMMGPPGAGGPGMGGMMGPPGGMGGGMGGPGGGMGGPGGGGPSGKRNLTALVGKVELLSRPNIQITLDAQQQAKFAAELAELRSAEKLSDDDAQKRLEALEALLTPEQKETLDAVALPRRGGGGGPGGGMMGPAPGGAGPGAEPDANPFAQEANEQRLNDLLSRLQPAGENKEPDAKNEEPTAENKEPAAKSDEPAADNKEPAAENKEAAE